MLLMDSINSLMGSEEIGHLARESFLGYREIERQRPGRLERRLWLFGCMDVVGKVTIFYRGRGLASVLMLTGFNFTRSKQQICNENLQQKNQIRCNLLSRKQKSCKNL